jgi:glycerol kinase
MNVGTAPVQSSHGLISTVAFQLPREASDAGAEDPVYYALEGPVKSAGSSVQWLRDALSFAKSSEDVSAMAAEAKGDSLGVYFVPALSGLLAPYWRDDARAAFIGLHHAVKKCHIARAVIEAPALQTRTVHTAHRTAPHRTAPHRTEERALIGVHSG